MSARRSSHAGDARARAAIRAKFIVDTARRHEVSLGLHRGSVFVWAPTAPSPELQLQCERSFAHAVRQNLRAITALASEPRGGG